MHWSLRRKSPSGPDGPDSMRPTDGRENDGPSMDTGSERVAVDASFRADAALRSAVTDNLKPLRVQSEAIARRVDRAFAEFTPNPLSSHELTRRNYVERGEDVGETLDRVVSEGVDAFRSSDAAPAITFRNRAELEELVTEPSESSSSAGKAELEPLLDFIDEKRSGSSLIKAPAYTRCKAQLQADGIVASVESPPDADADEAAVEDTTTTSHNGDQLVKNSVNLQMSSATSPEAALAYGSMPTIPNTADDDKTQARILETFQLRPGASDVTSYHDFHTLQIAFPHVWTRIFSGELESLGRELYREYVKLKDFGGSTTSDLRVSTLDDLRRLIEEVRKLSQRVEDEIPQDLRGHGENRGGSQGADDLGNAVRTGLGLATGGLSWVLEWALKEFAKLGSKPIITWEQFPGPWPPRQDKIECEKVEGVAPAGNVEIALRTAAESKLKIVELELFDEGTQRYVHGQRIDNSGHNTYVSMTLPTAWMKTSVLEFASEESSQWDTPGRYVLAELSRKISDRSRVTFYWKDS
jgi:hypothetical protein